MVDSKVTIKELSIVPLKFIPKIEGLDAEQIQNSDYSKLTKIQIDAICTQIKIFIKSNPESVFIDKELFFWMTLVLNQAVENSSSDAITKILIIIRDLKQINSYRLMSTLNETEHRGAFKGKTYAHAWVHQFFSIASKNDLKSFVGLEAIVETLLDISPNEFIAALTKVVSGESLLLGTSGISSLVLALMDSSENPYNQTMTKQLAIMLLQFCKKSTDAINLLVNKSHLSGVSLLTQLCQLMQKSIVNNSGLTVVLCDIINIVIVIPPEEIQNKIIEHFVEPISAGPYKGFNNFLYLVRGLLMAASQPNARATSQFYAIIDLVTLIYKLTPDELKSSLLIKSLAENSKPSETAANMLFRALLSASKKGYNVESLLEFIDFSVYCSGVNHFAKALKLDDFNQNQIVDIKTILSEKMVLEKFPALAELNDLIDHLSYISDLEFRGKPSKSELVEHSVFNNNGFDSLIDETAFKPNVPRAE